MVRHQEMCVGKKLNNEKGFSVFAMLGFIAFSGLTFFSLLGSYSDLWTFRSRLRNTLDGSYYVERSLLMQMELSSICANTLKLVTLNSLNASGSIPVSLNNLVNGAQVERAVISILPESKNRIGLLQIHLINSAKDIEALIAWRFNGAGQVESCSTSGELASKPKSTLP
jgi:hypothetical protein